MELSVNDDVADGRGVNSHSPNSSGACVSAFGKFLSLALAVVAWLKEGITYSSTVLSVLVIYNLVMFRKINSNGV